MAQFQMEYEFEQLNLKGFGGSIEISGIAHLVGDDEGSFTIDMIDLGDTRLGLRDNDEFCQMLFSKICDVIESDEAVHDRFRYEWNEYLGPDPDELRDLAQDR